jgi:hypothetical protein
MSLQVRQRVQALLHVLQLRLLQLLQQQQQQSQKRSSSS